MAKWESFNPGQLADDDINSITGGVNYYIKGDNLKLQANYVHTWSDLRDSSPSIAGRSSTRCSFVFSLFSRFKLFAL